MDLLDLGLTPNQYMAAAAVVRANGRITGAEIADVLGSSLSTGRRALADLVTLGLISRTQRGRYDFSYLTIKESPMTLEQSPVTISSITTSSNTNSVEVVEPIGSTTNGAAPRRAGQLEKVLAMVTIGRIGDPGPNNDLDDAVPVKKSKRPDKYHRINDPIEAWGIEHLVKEFDIRALTAFPTCLIPTNSRALKTRLAQAQELGFGIPILMQAMESFFTTRAATVPSHVQPSTAFINYLDNYLRQIPTEPEDDIDSHNAGWS